jgi:cell division protein FtsB
MSPVSPPREVGSDTRRRRRALALRAAVAAIVVIGLLFVVVFPLRAWFDQRDELARSKARLETITRAREALDAQAKHLQDPEEVERLAREQYGMVRRGERAWAAVPESTTTSTTLPAAP